MLNFEDFETGLDMHSSGGGAWKILIKIEGGGSESGARSFSFKGSKDLLFNLGLLDDIQGIIMIQDFFSIKYVCRFYKHFALESTA